MSLTNSQRKVQSTAQQIGIAIWCSLAAASIKTLALNSSSVWYKCSFIDRKGTGIWHVEYFKYNAIVFHWIVVRIIHFIMNGTHLGWCWVDDEMINLKDCSLSLTIEEYIKLLLFKMFLILFFAYIFIFIQSHNDRSSNCAECTGIVGH